MRHPARWDSSLGFGFACVLLLSACGPDGETPLEPPAGLPSAAASAGPRVEAPSGVVAVGVAVAQVDLSWIDNSGNESGFEIHRSSTGPGGPFTYRASVGSSTPRYSDTGTLVNASTPYCYVVRAYRRLPGKISYSAFSDAGCAPAGSVQVATKLSGVDLDPDGYTVALEAVTQSGAIWVSSASVPSGGTHTFSGIRAGSYYRITLTNVLVNCVAQGLPMPVTITGGETTPVTVDIACTTLPLPAAPDLADATPRGSTFVEVVWSDNSLEEDGFRIERSLDGGARWTGAGRTGTNERWFFDSELTAEQPVCYRVVAFNWKGESQPSNTDCTAPPAAPTLLAVTGVDQVTIDLVWKDNSSIEDGYEIIIEDWYSGEWYAVAAVGPGVTSYRHTDDYCAYCYAYAVVAVKDKGWSDVSQWGYPSPPP